MDIRDYLDLESMLSLKLQSEWAKDYPKQFQPIQKAINERQFKLARDLVKNIDLSETGKRCYSFMYTVYRGAVDFGAKNLGNGRSLSSSLSMDSLIRSVADQTLLSLEWSLTIQAQAHAMQLIAQAEQAETLVKAESAESVALKSSTDSNLEMIAGLNTSRLSSWGFLVEAQMTGVVRYKLSAVLDSRTSRFCRFINGKVFEVEYAIPVIEQALAAADPNDLKTIQPWPKQTDQHMAQINQMTKAQLIAAKLHVPPFHPHCRTLLVRLNQTTNLKKPQVQPLPSLPEVLNTTTEDFGSITRKFPKSKLGWWNDYVTHSPVDVMSVLSGYAATAYIDGTAAASTIKITAKGDIGFSWARSIPGLEFNGSVLFNPIDAVVKITKAQIIEGSQQTVLSQLNYLTDAVQKLARSVGAEKITIPVGKGQAHWLLGRGFVPSAYKWQFIRRDLQKRLVGDMNSEYLKQPQAVQDALKSLLMSKDEKAFTVLLNLKTNPGFISSLLSDVQYLGEKAL